MGGPNPMPKCIAVDAEGEIPVASWIVPAFSALNASGSAGKTWMVRPSGSPKIATATARQTSASSAERLPWTSSPFQSSALRTVPHSMW